jgi:pimeloyl-ACP methyl ester carboxylesterase
MARLKRLRLGEGVSMPFAEFGDRARPSLLIVPGIAEGLRPIGRPGAVLAAIFYRDLRAFRVLVASRRVPTVAGHTTEAMADDLAALLEAAAAGPATVHGLSLGGFVAQHLAARHPHLVERLVLGSTVAHVDARTAQIVDRWERLAQEARWAEFQRDMLETVYTGDMPARYRLIAEANRRGLRLMPGPLLVERFSAQCDAARRHDARSVLAHIRCPTLVLGGTDDVVTRPEQMRELVDAILGARLILFDRAGHGAFEQRKREWDEAILRFVHDGGHER